jgi:FdhD protein
MDLSTAKYTIIKAEGRNFRDAMDSLAVEEPLEIRLVFGPGENRTVKNISVTMRTPGNDAELAAGFLFTEGIITDRSELVAINHCFMACSQNKQNVIQAEMREGINPAIQNTERNFYTTSSCGVCGKSSIDAIKTVGRYDQHSFSTQQIHPAVLSGLPDALRNNQAIFNRTGGLHGCAVFSSAGELLLLREDVGRHNALDKLIGAALEMDWLPLCKEVLMLSGRISFELVQKAAMAGISIIAAIGAPSSLAVELAAECGITLIGFLSPARFNIYTHRYRISTAYYEDQN